MRYTNLISALVVMVTTSSFAGNDPAPTKFEAKLPQKFASETASTARSYLVKYSDGSAEKYVAKYSGNVDPNKWESGGPSTWNHPIDDRTCHWTITSYIRRDVCLVSKNGQTYCQGQLSTIWNTSTQNQGSAFILTNLASENCGQAEGRYQSDVANAVNGMAGTFNSVVTNDASSIKDQLKTSLGATSVDAQ